MLKPALTSPQLPDWDGAVWIGHIDISESGAAAGTGSLTLADADGYSRARLLVRRGLDPLGFVELPIVSHGVDIAELLAAVGTLEIPQQYAGTDSANLAAQPPPHRRSRW